MLSNTVKTVQLTSQIDKLVCKLSFSFTSVRKKLIFKVQFFFYAFVGECVLFLFNSLDALQLDLATQATQEST